MMESSRQARVSETRQLLCELLAFPVEIAALCLVAPRFVWTQSELMRQRVYASKVTFLFVSGAVTGSFNTARGR